MHGLRLRAWMLVVVAASLVAGCLSPASTGRAAPGSTSNGIVVVDPHDTEAPGVVVRPGKSAILGRVLDDSGLPLASAHASLLDTDNATDTDRAGWFRFEGLPPGDYTLRVERTAYRAAQARVPTTPGNVTRLNVTMVPLEDVGAGYRQHVHDYWAGRMQVQVKDSDVVWHRSKDRTPALSEINPLIGAAGQVGPSSCTSASPDKKHRVLSAFNARFSFDDPAQTVWPGSGLINLTATWNDADYGGTTIGFVWKSPDTGNWTPGPLASKGQTHSIVVGPGKWDSGHQTFTLWEFGMCTTDDTPELTDVNYPVLGKVHVRMELIRGSDPEPEPPHPRFWANASVPVVDFARKYSGAQISSGRSVDSSALLVSPPPPLLVPPGSKNLSLRIEWSYAISETNQPNTVCAPALSLVYSPANVAPFDRHWAADFARPQPASSGANWRLYDVSLKTNETDAFYQKRSNWAFMWGYEGQEGDDGWYNRCLASITVKVSATAWHDQTFRED